MIKTARQLKDLILNLSKEKSADAQILLRNYGIFMTGPGYISDEKQSTADIYDFVLRLYIE